MHKADVARIVIARHHDLVGASEPRDPFVRGLELLGEAIGREVSGNDHQVGSQRLNLVDQRLHERGIETRVAAVDVRELHDDELLVCRHRDQPLSDCLERRDRLGE